MRLSRTLLVAPGIYQLKARAARVTVLSSPEGLVLVDAGGRGSLRMLAAGVKALGWAPADIRLVVVTHWHPDHTGGLKEVVGASSARVGAHPLDARVIAGEAPLPTPHQHPLLASLWRPFLPIFQGKPVPVDVPLEDGASLPGAPDVRVVHTPGHTPGSICLYVASQRVLIVGDALTRRWGRLFPPAPSVTWDSHQAMESLKKLASLDVETICFSHYAPLRVNARGALQRLVEQGSR